MRYRQGFAFAFPLVFIFLIPAAHGDDAPTSVPKSVGDQLPGLQLLQGPWDKGDVHRESVLFVRGKNGPPSAKLLFDAERVLTVQGADGVRSFVAGRDYQVAPDGSGLELVPGSRIAFLEETKLFPPKGSANSIGHRAGQPETNVLFDNGHFFHDRQVEVGYVPRLAEWGAYRPTFAGKRLGRTLDKLEKKEPLTIVVSGDSISEGFNASEFTKTPPYMPPFPTLIAAQLEKTYGAKVTMNNLAVGGWSSANGVNDLDRLLRCKPDLAIIAYGMNDVGGRNPTAFKTNIATMLRRIREVNPTTEVILVATMTGNPDWVATPAEMFPAYRDALASLEGPGVVLADLTAVWQRLLRRKRHVDVTGNGVNHPDDYGHRVYAQAILALLVDPVRIPVPSGR
jgi:acyl-CoA thioesterase-1